MGEESMAHRKNQAELTIQGLIVPVAWDEEGNPLSVAVATFDENEYIVHRDEKGKHLLGLLRREVEVTGVVGIKDGIKTIKVLKYGLNTKLKPTKNTSREKHEDHINDEYEWNSRM
jgi:hypothetical protein